MESKPTEKEFRPHFGIDTSTIDSKGRVSFGKKKAEWLGNDFVLMVGQYGILEAIPEHYWLRRLAQYDEIDPNNPGLAAYKMLTFNTSEPGQNLDKDGRIVIPVEIRKEGGLDVPAGEKMEIKLVGEGGSVQIWPAKEYELFKSLGTKYRQDRVEQITEALRLMREFQS